MEFYNKLNDLLKSVRSIEKLDLLKVVSPSEKEKKYKLFKDKLIFFLKCNVLSSEAKKFRKYWIEYLSGKLIESVYPFCSDKESADIKKLLEQENNEEDNNNIKNDDDKRINENIVRKDKNLNNFEKQNNDININWNNNNILINNKINIEKVENFYPKNYVKEKNDKNDKKIIKKINNIKNIEEEKNKKNKYEYFINNSKKLEINDLFPDEDNENNIDKKQGINTNKKLNEEKIDVKINGNNNKIIEYINQNNNKINQIFEDSNEICDYSKDININMPKYKSNDLEKKEIIKINKISPKKVNIKSKKKIQKVDNSLSQKQQNRINELEQYYEEFIIENKIIKNLDSLNGICSKVFHFIKYEYIMTNQELKEKLITLICFLYPFSKGLKLEGTFNEKNLGVFLSKSLLDDDFKCVDFTSNHYPNLINDFLDDLKLDSDDGKNEVYQMFLFLVIARNLRECAKKKEEKIILDRVNMMLDKEFLISFKLIFILKYQHLYSQINEDFPDIYKGLHFIQNFYDEIFSDNKEFKLIKKDDISDNYIFGKDKFVLSFENIDDFNIDALFNKKDIFIYEKVFEKLKQFYKIDKHEFSDISDIINYSNNNFEKKGINFIFNLVELECVKYDNINNNFDNYRRSLINLEKEIFELGKSSLNLEPFNNYISKYYINENQKSAFDSLLYELKNDKNLKKYKDYFNLYPYGSITEFLGGNNSDIDIYLYIKELKDKKQNLELKIHILEDLESALYKIGSNVKKVISSRICVLKFKYECNNNEYDIDISLMGFCPYLHSILFRTYSLIEPRFALLAIALKKFVKIIKVKSQDDKIEYLNSFSWMLLLITFLQDIIKPQILPKLLSENDKSTINCPIQYGKNIREKNGKYNRNFKSFIDKINGENTFIPGSLLNKKSLYEIYKEKAKKEKKPEKNKLSCAELFLQFLEFIIYYFKPDSIYVNCSIESECFEPIYNILNFNDAIDKYIKDDRFRSYFKNKYCKSMTFQEKSKTRDGLILLRDPFDPYYNPGQSMKKGNLYIFLQNLKEGYLSLIKNGSFKVLKEEFKEKFEKEE